MKDFPDGMVLKNLPANARDIGSIPGSVRFPGVGNGNPLLVLKILWTEGPGGLESMGLQRVGHNWATGHSYKYDPIYMNMYIGVCVCFQEKLSLKHWVVISERPGMWLLFSFSLSIFVICIILKIKNITGMDCSTVP